MGRETLNYVLAAGLPLFHATSGPLLLPATTPLRPTLAPLPSVTHRLLAGVAPPLPPTTGAVLQQGPHHRAPGAPGHLRPLSSAFPQSLAFM